MNLLYALGLMLVLWGLHTKLDKVISYLEILYGYRMVEEEGEENEN